MFFFLMKRNFLETSFYDLYFSLSNKIILFPKAFFVEKLNFHFGRLCRKLKEANIVPNWGLSCTFFYCSFVVLIIISQNTKRIHFPKNFLVICQLSRVNFYLYLFYLFLQRIETICR